MVDNDESPLEGKVALVTGASSGIGRATAGRLGHEGAAVSLVARREDRLRDLARELEHESGTRTAVLPADVSQFEEVEEAVEETVETFGQLDIVVSNAGTSTSRGYPVDELSIEQYRTVVSVNVDGMFYTARATLPHLRRTNGAILFVGSASGKFPSSDMPVYAASKWWTRGFALSLAGHVGEDDVAVTVVNPSVVRTAIGTEHRADEELPVQRYGHGEVMEPTDVADAIAFAVKQDQPNAIAELDVFRRDRLSDF